MPRPEPRRFGFATQHRTHFRHDVALRSLARRSKRWQREHATLNIARYRERRIDRLTVG